MGTFTDGSFYDFLGGMNIGNYDLPEEEPVVVFELENVSTTPYSQSEATHFNYDTSAGDIVVSLMPAELHEGMTYHKVVAGENSVIITPRSGTLDGQSSITLTLWDSLSIYSDGTNYFAIQKPVTPPEPTTLNVVRNPESLILPTSPTNPDGEVNIQYGSDTEDLYVWDGSSWIKYENTNN